MTLESDKLILLSELKDKHRGRVIAVLGGGPSLPKDLARIPAGAILIAVNHHALGFCDPEYMVYSDRPDQDPAGIMPGAVRDFGGITISPGDSTSMVTFDVDAWVGYYSSNLAAWVALWMGGDPVILCGMDCYQGDSVYCHPIDYDVPVFHYPLMDHLRPWIEEGVHKLPDVKRVRVMSGPLSQVFPLFEESIDGF